MYFGLYYRFFKLNFMKSVSMGKVLIASGEKGLELIAFLRGTPNLVRFKTIPRRKLLN